jgi:hypothetical protein
MSLSCSYFRIGTSENAFILVYSINLNYLFLVNIVCYSKYRWHTHQLLKCALGKLERVLFSGKDQHFQWCWSWRIWNVFTCHFTYRWLKNGVNTISDPRLLHTRFLNRSCPVFFVAYTAFYKIYIHF